MTPVILLLVAVLVGSAIVGTHACRVSALVRTSSNARGARREAAE